MAATMFSIKQRISFSFQYIAHMADNSQCTYTIPSVLIQTNIKIKFEGQKLRFYKLAN